jgi:glycerate kinase
MGQRVKARWGLSGDGSTAIIEMAEAAGLPLVPPGKRDPKRTTTLGVGELIRAALDAGVTSLIVGIGGSATNDGGAGMAEALGVRFLDESGNKLGLGGAELARLHSVDISGKDPRIDRVQVTVASDVENTLCGANGASVIYAPQKGASAGDVQLLDRALLHYGRVIQALLGVDVLSVPGGGAAGGLGAGLRALCGAQLKRGIDVVLDLTKFDDEVRSADLVITGEGRIDEQVKFGKALAGVVERSHRLSVPVVAVVGSMEGERASFVNAGFLADLEPLVDANTSMEQAILRAPALISAKTRTLLDRAVSSTAER